MPTSHTASPRRIGGRALGAALAAAALLAWWAWPGPAPAPPAPVMAPGAAAPGAAAFPWASTPQAVLAPDGAQAGAVPAQAPLAAAPAGLALPAGPGLAPQQGVFRTDAQGRLQVDAGLRQRTEHLLALHDGDALATRLEAELGALPAAAAAQARELVGQFQAYQSAQRAAYPPGQAPLVPEEGLAQLAALQAMRAGHFGAAAAQRMFAADDAVTHRLLTLMRDESSALLSMEQKAMRAQARYDIERGAARP
ncbi:hypothetical protein [Aquabacterium sp. OR-4]|uniref:hypothetical protein n=1 Tax=Aquabacterium sp. OR-4 TaxID=2978127 RepID=UPI0021B24912|nr:hypothetical protein [Aquabacterium sp. OR-4]MDT7838040.1 hypothetical protein [Aquabacterium sp. OR-4]